ncbi:MAG: DMT family transporter [Thermaerobacter sp.]|nr:DMT family transporter [Thermaerobacter sp.]
MPSRFRLYAGLVAVAVIWGSSFVAGKYAVGMASPVPFAALRFALASVLLLPLLFAQEGRRGMPRRRELPGLVFLGLTGIFGYNLCFFYGLRENAAGLSALVVAANPVLINLLAAALLGERLRPAGALGLVAALAGVFLVLDGGTGRLHLAGLLEPRRFLLYGAAGCWALYTLEGKVLLRRISPLKATAWASLLGTVPLAALGLWHGGLAALTGLSLGGWLLAAYFAVFVTVLAFLWYYRGVAVLGAGRAAAFIPLLPVVALGLSAVVYRETMSWLQLAGAAAVVGGVVLLARPRGERGAAEAAEAD